MTNLHAHVSTYSVDCDGPIERSNVMTMRDEEIASDFGDIEFHNRVVASVVNTYSLGSTGTLTVTRLSDGDVRIEWHEPTDEGHTSTEALFCNDDCDLGETHYRDVRAEEAGY